ncbi:MAG TPA: hypothetical protein PLG80_08200 [Syntrophales bacterium]|nr:hypothetical protein [Syntrophales bacterium]HPO36005.1 hypothetical protein [Syntrophales bacterium]
MRLKYLSVIWAFFAVCISQAMAAEVAYIEGVEFTKAGMKERIVISVSRPVTVSSAVLPGELTLKLDNCYVPEDFRRRLGEGKLTHILYAVTEQGAAGESRWAQVKIAWKRAVPFKVEREEKKVVVDFFAASESTVSKEDRITVDFQKADIRAVFRLLAEQTGRNIVLSPEVKGEVTLTMKNVPWEKVIDTIAETYGLVKRDMEGIITVMSYEKVKKDEAEKRAAEESRLKAEEFKKEALRKEEAEKGKTRQIVIEAKIMETTSTFSRSLGVQWGGAFRGSFGGGNYSYGLVGGTSGISTPVTQLTPGSSIAMISGATTAGPLALNFSSTALNPTFGVIVGGANAVLNARLNALETDGTGKVISAPRVVIADGEKAVIEQGEQIPVVTPATANNPASTTYKDAVLRLQVKPTIIVNDYILLEIVAQNDRANKSEKDPATGNMPIYTSKVDSKVAVRNGDTVVIGGVKKSEDNVSRTGVPWLSQIPILGWLFKTDETTRSDRELLIFITPRIIPPGEKLAQH